MSRIVFHPSARQDLQDIETYIADDNPIEAATFVTFLEHECEVISEYPRMGVARPDLALYIRMFPVRDYLIFYQPIESGIEVIHIVHASRDTHALTF